VKQKKRCVSSHDPFDIPMLSEIFEVLRRGRHICSEDGDLYWAVRDNLDALEGLFYRLGFRLEAHPRDFYQIDFCGTHQK